MGKNSGAKESNKIAQQQRADEQARQAAIRAGSERINKLFDGSVRGVNAASEYQAGQTYYNEDGSVWTPTGAMITETVPAATGMFGTNVTGLGDSSMRVANNRDSNKNGSGVVYSDDRSRAAPKATTRQRQLTAAEEFARSQGKVFGGVEKTGGFNDDFYNKQKQAYMDYANPQLQSQYDEARKQLTFALARSGNLDGSVRAQQEGKLDKENGIQAQAIADQAQGFATQSRNAVEAARADLLSGLNASGDADGAANMAMAKAATLSQPQQFSPIANLFADFTSSIGAGQAANAAFNAQGTGGGTGTQSFGRSGGAMQVRK